MLEKERIINVSNLVEKRDGEPVVSLHVASYFRVRKRGEEQKRILISHGLEPVYDPARITPKINEELWEDGFADKNGFFTFPPKRLILGHTSENILVPANIGLRMREFFRSAETRKTFPLMTNCSASLIHPGSTVLKLMKFITQVNSL